jgi:ABC-type amino acid transport substrate-binding protein/ABC-type amino acid transport system permease subunit
MPEGLAAAARCVALLSGLLLALLLPVASAASPGNADAGCASAGDALARVQCSGRLRIGVRHDYPPFAARHDGQLAGFEIDLARALAEQLGVAPQFVAVTPANRIAALGEDRVELVLATMGHTLQRDAEARFVRPHYYESRTVVVGERRRKIASLEDVAGRTICVTVGNSSNAELAERGANLLLFGGVAQLIEQLSLGACALAAQDDSLFAPHFLRPAFARQYELKFGFSPLPWGMAVRPGDGETLALALAQQLRELHADGQLLELARRHGMDTTFLSREQARWRSPPCAQGAAALDDPHCLQAPHDSQLQPTAFAPTVQRFEDWLHQRTGLGIALPMLKTRIALELFLQGIAYSLLLVAGAVGATLACSLGFAIGLGAQRRWLRWPARLLQVSAQSTPLMLLMLFAGVLLSSWGTLSAPAALLTAVLVLGLFNGSHGGQAIAEARAALGTDGGPAPLRAGVQQARAQLVAFAVNATRGSPSASLIGVPELLSAQTDISAFASERLSSFALLLLFYMAVVSLVVWLGQRWLARAALR